MFIKRIQCLNITSSLFRRVEARNNQTFKAVERGNAIWWQQLFLETLAVWCRVAHAIFSYLPSSTVSVPNFPLDISGAAPVARSRPATSCANIIL